jgi:hypothetical protein
MLKRVLTDEHFGTIAATVTYAIAFSKMIIHDKEEREFYHLEEDNNGFGRILSQHSCTNLGYISRISFL